MNSDLEVVEPSTPDWDRLPPVIEMSDDDLIDLYAFLCRALGPAAVIPNQLF